MLGSSADFLIPFDLGGGRTLLAVLGTDYRASDLGRCQEIALALAVTLRHAPTGVPGAMFLGIGVSGELACDSGRVIWGLRKVFNKDLSIGRCSASAPITRSHCRSASRASDTGVRRASPYQSTHNGKAALGTQPRRFDRC